MKKKIYQSLIGVVIFCSCENYNTTKNEKIHVKSIKTNYLAVGELFDYTNRLVNKDIDIKKKASLYTFLTELNGMIFLRDKKEFPIIDTIQVDSNAINIKFSFNYSYINSVTILNINSRYKYFAFLYDPKYNEGIEKNGFYIYDSILKKTLFVKCLSNDLPFHNEIMFHTISTIAEVDTNLVEKEFYVYENSLLSHVGLYIYNNKDSLNIRTPSVKNKLNNVTIERTTTIFNLFERLNSIYLLFSLKSHYKICNKSKMKRETITYKWGLGYNNNYKSSLHGAQYNL